ncbi:MAG: UDP-N-acetylmuramoyl-L-alanyl-D-glutamate--2,6-diaminopimelate ligase [Pseudomonadota bacterium]
MTVLTAVMPSDKLPTTAAVDIDALCIWLAKVAPGASLTSDSRCVKPGDVFLAYAAAPTEGTMADGRRFTDDAIERGARAILFDDSVFTWSQPLSVPHQGIARLRQIAGQLANRYYGRPDQNMFVVAVTGTNGKTSCTQWLGTALSRNNTPTAVIGTFGVGLFEAGKTPAFDATGYTTPDAVQLQHALAAVRNRGAGALAIEASSIGLHQHRMQGLHVDVALFTNLSRDHLDYHGDMAAYESAKTALFDWPGLRHAVINLDDPMGPRLIARLREQASTACVTTYSLNAPSGRAAQGEVRLHASELRTSHAGTQFQLRVDSDSPAIAPCPMMHVRTQLVGDFNVSNVLGVLGVLLARGVSLDAAVVVVEALQPVAGRMQQLGAPDQPLVVIDYAHTPDALEKTLASLRLLAQTRHGALWCVFGCGGDRDSGKRPQMGAVAQAADHVIVTSDNPRSEVPAAIIAEIVAGADGSVARGRPAPQVIEDRATAILWALRHAAKADVVLLAGKGHENFQEIKGRKLHFLDADHAALALAARATMKGSV